MSGVDVEAGEVPARRVAASFVARVNARRLRDGVDGPYHGTLHPSGLDHRHDQREQQQRHGELQGKSAHPRRDGFQRHIRQNVAVGLAGLADHGNAGGAEPDGLLRPSDVVEHPFAVPAQETLQLPAVDRLPVAQRAGRFPIAARVGKVDDAAVVRVKRREVDVLYTAAFAMLVKHIHKVFVVVACFQRRKAVAICRRADLGALLLAQRAIDAHRLARKPLGIRAVPDGHGRLLRRAEGVGNVLLYQRAGVEAQPDQKRDRAEDDTAHQRRAKDESGQRRVRFSCFSFRHDRVIPPARARPEMFSGSSECFFRFHRRSSRRPSSA